MRPNGLACAVDHLSAPRRRHCQHRNSLPYSPTTGADVAGRTGTGPRFAQAVEGFFWFLLLSCGSYVPAPPAQPSYGRLRSRCLVSALRLFPPTTQPLLALRVAPAPSGTAPRCSASRQKTPGGEGKLAGHQSRPRTSESTFMTRTRALKLCPLPTAGRDP